MDLNHSLQVCVSLLPIVIGEFGTQLNRTITVNLKTRKQMINYTSISICVNSSAAHSEPPVLSVSVIAGNRFGAANHNFDNKDHTMIISLFFNVIAGLHVHVLICTTCTSTCISTCT